MSAPRRLRRYSQRNNLSTLSEINITPLLDLAFVLLIIFIITTPLIENSASLAILPSSGAANAAVDAAKVQIVSIDRAESIMFNDEVIDAATLTARLAALKQSNADVAVVIRPDRELPVQTLISLMDAVQRAQITKVGIATKPETP
jgi:biopolymer transport protein ExbD